MLASVLIIILDFLGMEGRNSQLERVYGLWVQSQEIKAGRILVLDSLSLDCYLNSAPILYNFEIWKTSFQYLYEGFIVEWVLLFMIFKEIYKNWLQLNVCDYTKDIRSPISILKYIYLIQHKMKCFYYIAHGSFRIDLYYCCEKLCLNYTCFF